MCMHCRPLIDAIDRYIQKADDDFEDMLEDEGRAIPKKTIEIMNVIEDGIALALIAETDHFIKTIKKKSTLKELMDVFEEIKEKDVYCDEIKAVVSKQLHELVPELVKGYVKFVDKEIKITSISRRTYDWIDSWSEQLADLMKLTSHKQIEDILKRGIDAGSDISSVTLDIMNSGIRNEYYRARRVAVTEMLRAHNVSRQEAAMQNPCITEKMWRHTGSHKNEPRENHVAMDGQRVPKTEPFELVDKYGDIHHPMYPTDPVLPPEESINCHCIAQDIVDEDILAMSLEERQRLQQEALDSMNAEWEEELNAKNKAKAGIEENLPKGADNSGGSDIKYKDITSQWKSNNGSQVSVVKELKEYSVNGVNYKVDNKHVTLDYSNHEKEIAELISSTTGKEVHIAPRISYPLGISTPDYVIDGKKYDLKTIVGESKNVLYNAVSKKKQQSSNFVFDVSGCPLSFDELSEQIGKLYTSKHTRFIDETIMIKSNNIIFAAKRKTEI